MWVPLVLVGSVLYWTVALGLGGLSVSFLSQPAQEALELPPTAEEPIVVHLASGSEAPNLAPTIVDAPTTTAADDGTGSLPATDDSAGATGQTSY
jgi:hypothetical protein